MKRKEFIQSGSLLIAGSLMAKESLFDVVNGETIYGQNEKRYKLVKDWVRADAATLPVKIAMKWCRMQKGGSYY